MKQAAAGSHAAVILVENHSRDEQLTWAMFVLDTVEVYDTAVQIHPA